MLPVVEHDVWGLVGDVIVRLQIQQQFKTPLRDVDSPGLFVFDREGR